MLSTSFSAAWSTTNTTYTAAGCRSVHIPKTRCARTQRHSVKRHIHMSMHARNHTHNSCMHLKAHRHANQEDVRWFDGCARTGAHQAWTSAHTHTHAHMRQHACYGTSAHKNTRAGRERAEQTNVLTNKARNTHRHIASSSGDRLNCIRIHTITFFSSTQASAHGKTRSAPHVKRNKSKMGGVFLHRV